MDPRCRRCTHGACIKSFSLLVSLLLLAIGTFHVVTVVTLTQSAHATQQMPEDSTDWLFLYTVGELSTLEDRSALFVWKVVGVAAAYLVGVAVNVVLCIGVCRGIVWLFYPWLLVNFLAIVSSLALGLGLIIAYTVYPEEGTVRQHALFGLIPLSIGFAILVFWVVVFQYLVQLWRRSTHSLSKVSGSSLRRSFSSLASPSLSSLRTPCFCCSRRRSSEGATAPTDSIKYSTIQSNAPPKEDAKPSTNQDPTKPSPPSVASSSEDEGGFLSSPALRITPPPPTAPFPPASSPPAHQIIAFHDPPQSPLPAYSPMKEPLQSHEPAQQFLPKPVERTEQRQEGLLIEPISWESPSTASSQRPMVPQPSSEPTHQQFAPQPLVSLGTGPGPGPGPEPGPGPGPGSDPGPGPGPGPSRHYPSTMYWQPFPVSDPSQTFRSTFPKSRRQEHLWHMTHLDSDFSERLTPHQSEERSAPGLSTDV